jgi:hypothetical protein
MALCPVAYKIAHRRGVQSKMTSYFTLQISVFFNCFCHLTIALFSIAEYTLLEYFFKRRSVCVPLAPWDLGHLFVACNRAEMSIQKT